MWILVAGVVLSGQPNRKSVRAAQIFLLNRVGHHTRRRLPSVDGRAFPAECVGSIWSRRSPWGVSCCGDVRPALA
jgi:hypothetical protein